MVDGVKTLPEALRIIGKRLESDDMVETTVLNQAADELELLRDELEFERNSIRILRADNPFVKKH